MPLLDGRMEKAYESVQEKQLGDTLLYQQSRVHQINCQNLRQAKNIEDLVQIDIASLTGDNPNYFGNDLDEIHKEQIELDTRYDPINYKQRLAHMASPNFLVTQGILSNSGARSQFRSQPRSTYHHRKLRLQKNTMLPEIDGFSQPSAFQKSVAESYTRGPSNLTERPDKSRLSKKATGLSLLKDQELSQSQQNGLKNKDSQPATEMTDKDEDQDRMSSSLKPIIKTTPEMGEKGRNSTRTSYMLKSPSQVVIDHLASNQSDPVRKLQALFGKKKVEAPRKVRKVSTNHIMQKYRRMEQRRAREQKSSSPAKDQIEILSSEWAGGSTRVGSSTFDYRDPTGKPMTSFTGRDMFDNQKVTSEFGRFSTTSRNRPYQTQANSDNHPQSAPFPKRIPQSQMLSDRPSKQTKPAHSPVDDENNASNQQETPFSGTQQAIKDKLQDIRQLFASDDEKEDIDKKGIRNKLERAAANLQNWDLDGHKIMYEEAIGQRRKQLEALQKIEVPFRPTDAGQPAAQSPSKAPKEDDFKTTEYVFEGERINLPDLTYDISDRDMREFLVQRILQLKMHTFGQVKSEINSENRYKFKASTLFNLQPSHERKKYVKALTGEPISSATSTIIRSSNFQTTRQHTPNIPPPLCQRSPSDNQLDDISEIREASKVDESICMQSPMNKTFQPMSGQPGGFTNETTLKQMIDGEIPQEEEFFSFIQKLKDPQAGKNLTARERNFYLALKQALFKIDKEFEKKEKVDKKERTKQKEEEHRIKLEIRAQKRQELQEEKEKEEEVVEEPVSNQQDAMERLIEETQRLEEAEEKNAETLFQQHDQSITHDQQAARTITQQEKSTDKPSPKKECRVKTTTDGRKIDLAEYAASSGEQLSGSRYQSGDTIGMKNKKGQATRGQPGSSDVTQTQHTLVCADKSDDILENPLKDHIQTNDVITQANNVNCSIPFTDASVHVSPKAQPFKSEAAQNTYRTGGSDVNYAQTQMGIEDLHIADQSQFILESNNVMKGPYFCPKRFNRFPRFSIFIKDDQTNLMNKYEQENTVSLSPEFLSILMENKDQAILQAVQNQRSSNTAAQNARIAVGLKSLDDAKLISQSNQADEFLVPENMIELAGAAGSDSPRATDDAGTSAVDDLGLGQSPTQVKGSYMPPDVIQWNEYMKSKFDPFEKVVLIKGIDNSILTSYRTLKGENNTVSDTYKIVHKKFLPQELQSQRFYKAMMVNRAKNNLYPVTVAEIGDEEFEDITAAELTKGADNVGSNSSSPTGRGGSPTSNNTKNENLQSVLKQSMSPKRMQENDNGFEESIHQKSKLNSENEADAQSQVWQHISLNNLAKKSSLASQQQQKLEKGKSMKAGAQQLQQNDNIDISSQDLLDPVNMDQQLQYVSSQTWNRRSPGIDKVVINEQSHHGEEPNSIEVGMEKDTLGESQGPVRGKFGTGQLSNELRMSQDPIAYQNTTSLKPTHLLQPSASKLISSKINSLQFDITRIKKTTSPTKDSMSAWNAQLNSETIDSMINADLNLLAQDAATFGPPAGYTPTGVFVNSTQQRNPFRGAQKKKDEVQGRKRPDARDGVRRKKQPDTPNKTELTSKTTTRVVQVPDKIKAPVATVFFARNGLPEYQAIQEEQSILVDHMNEHSKVSDIRTVHGLDPNFKTANDADEFSISQMKQNTVSEEQPSQGAIRSPVLSNSSDVSRIDRHNRSALQDQPTFRNETTGSHNSSVSPRPIFMRKVSPPRAVATHARKSVSPPSPVMSEVSPDATPEPRRASIISSMMEKVVQKMQTHSRVGPIIDSLYKKERKYVSNADKDNYLNFRSPIFELQKYHALKTNPILCTTIEDEADSDEDNDSSHILNSHKKTSSLSPRPAIKKRHEVVNRVVNSPGQQEWYTKKMQLLKSDIPLLQGSASPGTRFARSDAVSDGRNRSSDGEDTTTQGRDGIYTAVKGRDVNSPFVMNIRSNNGAQSLGGPFVVPSGTSSKYQLQNHTNTTQVLNQGAQIVRQTTDSYSKINVGGVTVDSLTKSKAIELKKTAYPSQSTVGGPNRHQITDGEYTDPADTTTYHNEEIYGHNQPFGFIGNSSTKKD